MRLTAILCNAPPSDTPCKKSLEKCRKMIVLKEDAFPKYVLTFLRLKDIWVDLQ